MVWPAGRSGLSLPAVNSRGLQVGQSPRRVVLVDLLRLFATFQMVQGHTLDAVLDQSVRHGGAFDVWIWTRGLTSVAFLFAAGFSFHLATLARLDRHLADPVAVRRRLRRGLLLIVLGYALHLPVAALGADPTVARAALSEAVIVDVLQCIGLSILVLEGLALLLRKTVRVITAAALLAVAAIALAPLAAAVEPAGPLTPLLNYLSPRAGSIFPMLPWAGYVFAGVVAAAVAVPRPGRSTLRPALVLLTGGVALAVAGLLLAATQGPAALGAPAVGPGILKLGVVVTVAGLLGLAARSIARLPRALEILAGETLIIYASHVLFLYGAGWGLAHTVGPTVALGPAVALAAIIIAASACVGLAWHRLKRVRPAGLRAALARRPRTG